MKGILFLSFLMITASIFSQGNGNGNQNRNNNGRETFSPWTQEEGKIHYTEGSVGIGTAAPQSKLSIKNGGQAINLLTGNNSSGYTLNVGVNNDGINFVNNSKIRGFNFKNSNGELLNILSNGNIGIGISSPQSKLAIKNGGQAINFLTGNNSSGYALNVGVNDDGINLANNSKVRGFNFKNFNGTLMKLSANGYLGIGTTNPDAKLTVKGKIHAEEVKIDLSVPAPDYVFKKDYDLLSIEQVQKHIQEKGHLPNIPSAKTMETEGVALGLMNMKLLEKIEELTLYTIAQEKQLKKQKEINTKLESRLTKLEELVIKK